MWPTCKGIVYNLDHGCGMGLIGVCNISVLIQYDGMGLITFEQNKLKTMKSKAKNPEDKQYETEPKHTKKQTGTIMPSFWVTI